jgi:membrane-associated phospholipid phosphatase
VPYGFSNQLAKPWCWPTCNKADVNAFDRWVVGYHSAAADGWSTGLLIGSLAAPLVLFNAIDAGVSHPGGKGGPQFATDLLILAEVDSVNLALNTVTKFAVRRPRPLVYDSGASDRDTADAGLSFYSGHSALSFGSMTTYAYLFMKRHPSSPFVVPVWILGEGVATATAALRIFAGKHFLSDVLTGAAIGASTGLLIPYLRLRTESTSFAGILPSNVTVLPTQLPGGAGAMVIVR